MRASHLLLQESAFGLFTCGMIAMWTHLTGDAVPLAAGVFLAVLLALPVAFTAVAGPELTVGERRRLHCTRHVLLGSYHLMWILFFLCLVWASHLVLSHGFWSLTPLLMVACAGGVASRAVHRRERWELREALAQPELTGPKVIGIRSPDQVPPGWTPLLVHRIDRGPFDALVDYRIIVDGDRVGALGPGQTLVVGLPPGPHRVQGRYGRLTNAPVPLLAEPGEALHLTIEPVRPDRQANRVRSRDPGAYFRMVQIPAPERD